MHVTCGSNCEASDVCVDHLLYHHVTRCFLCLQHTDLMDFVEPLNCYSYNCYSYMVNLFEVLVHILHSFDNLHFLDLGAERTKDAGELLYVRQKLVLVAKAFQLQAIDLVHIDYKGIFCGHHCSLETYQILYSKCVAYVG
jgi:HpcH/HpaI aldolase/citrate lyase family